MITLTPEQKQAIARHAAETYPHECCGALLGALDGETKIVTEVRPLSNVHEDDHSHRYLVSSEEMRGLIREERTTGIRLLGFYHSHPDGVAKPSRWDSEWAFPVYSYLIVAVVNGVAGEMTAWVVNEDDYDSQLKEEGITE